MEKGLANVERKPVSESRFSPFWLAWVLSVGSAN